jgi:hypothetical protein
LHIEFTSFNLVYETLSNYEKKVLKEQTGKEFFNSDNFQLNGNTKAAVSLIPYHPATDRKFESKKDETLLYHGKNLETPIQNPLVPATCL